MENIKLKLFVVVLFGFSIPKGYCQSVYVPSGGHFANSKASMSWSVGQLVDNSCLGPNAKLNNGIQQPYDYKIEAGINNTEADQLIIVYPNPTSDFCTLKIKNIDDNYSYKIYGLKGEFLDSEKIYATTTLINVYNSSCALIVVYKEGEVQKKIKVIHK